MDNTLMPTPKIISDEWDIEPDYMQGIYFGLPCFIRRHEHFKTLNGYVGVPKGSRWFEEDYTDIDCEVHGDLTFSSGGTHDIFGYYWWLGFDCNHCFDFNPGMALVAKSSVMDSDSTYKNMLFVQEQCISLAYQLCDLKLNVDHTPFSSERILIEINYG